MIPVIILYIVGKREIQVAGSDEAIGINVVWLLLIPITRWSTLLVAVNHGNSSAKNSFFLVKLFDNLIDLL